MTTATRTSNHQPPQFEEVMAFLHCLDTKLDGIRLMLVEPRRDYVTVEQLAGEVNRVPFTVRRWIREGRLAATRLGTGRRGRLLIPREEVARFMGCRGKEVID